MSRRYASSLLLFTFVALLPWDGARAWAAELQTVELVLARGVQALAVELVTTPAAIAQGLKGRKGLPDGRGMLFDFGFETNATMSMKDTEIPLDMIFIRTDGRIHHIVEDQTPLSERQIYSGGPVRGVLEVRAGTVRRLGIAVGDRVSHRIFTGGR
jgi:uncharacterized protein